MTRTLACLALVAAVLFAGTPAPRAADMLTGGQITALVAGNTVTGAMGDSKYTEFYQADGVIKGDGYAGAWTIEGDAMCFQYGSDPKTCWQVAKNGEEIQWINDGKLEGTGSLLPGNPNNY